MSMKSGSLELREAHKVGGGAASFCCILWDHKAEHFVTSSSSDPLIRIHDGVSLSTKVLWNHLYGVTALALSHNSSFLAAGSVDHCVKLFKFPSGEFHTSIKKISDLPIRVLAFNVSGNLLAAAGDDTEIKIYITSCYSIVLVLKGHEGPITGLDFAPNGMLLASLDSTGTVKCWQLQDYTCQSTTFRVASPDSALSTSMLRWSPDGQTLAVSGSRNGLVMYDSLTEEPFVLSGGHVGPICCLAWAPNGKYIATSGLDKQVLLWDLDKKKDIHRLKFDEKISCMAWKPNSNALSVIDVWGKYGIWEPVVPSSMLSPILSSASQSARVDSDSDDGYAHTENLAVRSRVSKSIAASSSKYKMQSPFQPGATPQEPGKRTYLCYNMLGWITKVELEHGGGYRIEADFHVSGRGPPVMPMNDIYDFTMASINENGCVFATSFEAEKNISVLCYRPSSSSLASYSEWTKRFEGEEVKAVANGSGWVAAVTSLNILYIFSEGGLQKDIIFLDGPVVTAAGCKDQLALVYCLRSNEQVLEFRVFDISGMTQQGMAKHLKGRVPLTPRSHLTWIGFSEEGYLSSYDSEGVLRVFTSKYGGKWTPVFRKKKNQEENYWIVGLNSTSMYCIACKHPEVFPQVTPKPFLTIRDLFLPLPTSESGGAASLGNELMLKQLFTYEIQRRVDDMASAGVDNEDKGL